jgi:hypothetical protein
MKAVLLNVTEDDEGNVSEATSIVELSDEGSQLQDLNALVGGYIEAIGLWPEVTAYLNEEGKLDGMLPNRRATQLARFTQAIMPDDYIAGPLVVIGFDPETGENRDIPDSLANVLTGESLTPVLRHG